MSPYPTLTSRLAQADRTYVLTALAIALAITTYLISAHLWPEAVFQLWWPFKIITCLIAVYCIYEATSRLRNKGNLENHPELEILRKSGDFHTQMKSLESEYQEESEVWSPMRFTKTWIIHDDGATFVPIPAGAVAWAYKIVTDSGSVAGVVKRPVDSFDVMICTRDGSQHKVACPESAADNIVLCIQQRAPGALMGYDEHLHALWRRDPKAALARIEGSDVPQRPAEP